jgi:hypothetical protein
VIPSVKERFGDSCGEERIDVGGALTLRGKNISIVDTPQGGQFGFFRGH